MITAGIDAGSRAIKVVLFDHERTTVVSSAIGEQGVHQQQLAADLFASALQSAQVSREEVGAVIATGYGRNRVAFAETTFTEISCHARGVRFLVPEVQTIIEIGGQDSKVITLDAAGRVRDFAMNDRCAAGTGRFLEMLAGRLSVDLAALGELSRNSQKPALISSMCVVFAETEIIGLLADGTPAADIAAGVQKAIATRVVALAGRSVTSPVCFTGGVALQPGMVQAVEAALECSVRIPSHPQFTGALGAALMAREYSQVRS